MNHEDYCSYKISKKLKEKGFDWETDSYYWRAGPDYPGIKENIEIGQTIDWNNYDEKTISAPTLWEAQKWLKKVKGLDITIIPYAENGKLRYNVQIWSDDHKIRRYNKYGFRGYKDSLSYAVMKALGLRTNLSKFKKKCLLLWSKKHYIENLDHDSYELIEKLDKNILDLWSNYLGYLGKQRIYSIIQILRDVQEWLKEEDDVLVLPISFFDPNLNFLCWGVNVYEWGEYKTYKSFQTYEEAFSEGISKALLDRI